MFVKKLIIFLFVNFIFNSLFSQNVCVDMEAYRNNVNHNANVLHTFANKKLLWNNKKYIRVKFFGGSDFIRRKIIQYASEWEKYANIHFQFVNTGYAEIRISFVKGGSWSYIGKTSSTSISQNQPSMNFGWFTNYTSNREFKRTILHEFGHALGLLHEHKHSHATIKWNLPKVYAYYQTKQGWTKEEVRRNVIDRYGNNSNFTNSVYDSKSIMHYSIPKELTLDGYYVPWNTELSATDKKNISELYPGKKLIIDSDGDGISDDKDRCPNTFGSIYNYGCPKRIVKKVRKDSDNDGIYDDEDHCPYEYGSRYNNGCPKRIVKKVRKDSDNDGVYDDEDHCPYEYGSQYNNGCPEIELYFGTNADVMYGLNTNYIVDNSYKAKYIYDIRHNLNFQIGVGLYPKFAYSSIHPFVIINVASLKILNFSHTQYMGGIGAAGSLGIQPELGFRVYLDNDDAFFINFSSSYHIPYYKYITYNSDDSKLDNSFNLIDKSYIDSQGFAFSIGLGLNTFEGYGVKLDYFVDTSLFFSNPIETGIISNRIGSLRLSFIFGDF